MQVSQKHSVERRLDGRIGFEQFSSTEFSHYTQNQWRGNHPGLHFNSLDSLVLCRGKLTHLQTAKILNKNYCVKMVEADKQQRVIAPSATYSLGVSVDLNLAGLVAFPQEMFTYLGSSHRRTCVTREQ